MKLELKQPLVLVLAGQMIVLAAAVGFLVARAGAPAPQAPKKHVAKVEAPEEPTEELHPLPHVKLSEPPPPTPPPATGDAGGNEWAQFPSDQPATKLVEPPPSSRHAEPPAPVVAQAQPSAPESSFDELISGLVAGNARFVEGVSRQRDVAAVRASLASGERADAVVVTCTDSRVVPELLFDQPLGTFAVVRSPGAQVDDASAKAVEESVKRLHAKAVLVLGHFGCHHVSQALEAAGPKPTPRAASLVSALGGLKSGLEGETLETAAVETSVSFTAKELRRRSKLLARSKDVTVLRVVYAPKSGAVRWLDAETEPAPEPAPRNGRR